MWSQSLRVMFLRFIQVVAWIHSFYWILHFIYSLIDGHLGCFHFPASMKKATMNVHVQVLCGHVLLSMFLGVELLGHIVTPSSLLCISKLRSEPKFSAASTVFHRLPLRMKLLPSIPIVQYLCIVLTSWPQSSAIPSWLFSSYCELLENRDRHSAFCIAKTSSTLPCIQQELCYVLLNGWRVLILHDQTYKIYLILNVHFKMLTIKCLANNT